MVRKVIHTNIFFGAIAVALVGLFATNSPAANAANCQGQTTQCEEPVTFQVNVGEYISVSLTRPENWAQGDVNELIRNKVTLNVVSNYAGGFQASMSSLNSTNLVNQEKATSTIPTLGSTTTASAFPVNSWGYSIDDSDAGLGTANYNAMQTSAISLITKAQSSNVSTKDVYFGAKAGMSTDSGTYANTIVFTVVSGVIDNNESTSNNPVTPIDTSASPAPQNPVYDSSNNRTVYTSTIVANNQSTTTTQISKGDITASYAAPQGVTASSIDEGTPLATGLAITAGIAAMTGAGFFVAARYSGKKTK